MAAAQPEPRSSFKLHWEYILTTGILAGVVAVIASDLSALKPQRYAQLIVGNLAWHSGSKQPDYVLLLSLVVSFFLLYTGFYYLANVVRQRNGALAEAALRQLLVFSLLPFGILLGKVFVNADDISPEVAIECLVGSLLLVLVTVSLAIGLTLKRLPPLTGQEYIEAVGGSLLFVCFSLLVGSALSLTIGRLNPSWQLTNIGNVAVVSGIGVLLLWLPLLKIWLERFNSLSYFRSKLRVLLWAVQGFFPLFFLVLLPLPWSNGKEKLQGYPVTLALLVLLGGCIAIAYIDWVRRFKLPVESDQGSSVFAGVSPIVLIALLLYIKVNPASASALIPDDYHWGEYLLPWWLWQNFHYVPFWDYEPARGLVNYVFGLFASLFFDGTAIAYQVTNASGLLILPYLSITFLALARAIGTMPAFLACLLMPMGNGVSEIDCIVTVVLCSLSSAFLKWQPSQWLSVWGTASVALLLFAPGQGGLLILAMLPLAGFAFAKAALKERQRLIVVVAGWLLLLLLLSLTTPLGKMLLGAVRYGVEQSSINSVAHGIPWSDSAGTNPVLSYSLWEMVRTAWMLVGMTAGLLLFRAVVDKAWAERYRYAVLGLPIFLLMVLFIPRAAGRIDSGNISRLGIASTWAVCLLLPIVLITACDQRKKAGLLMLVAFLGGIVVGIPVPDSLLGKPTRTIDVSILSKLNSDRLGLPNLAHALIEPAQFDRLQAIKQVLKAGVDPGETYLDLTNHNADYFYFGYPPPVQVGAFYNMPHRNQQLRAVQKLEATPPPLVLASANNLLFDGGTAALRAHLLYRYVAERYTPIAVDKFIYLVRPDRLERLKTRLAMVATSTIEVGETQDVRLKLLDQVFLVDDLQKIPRAWGLSFETLRATLRLVKTLDLTTIATLHAVEKTGQETYRVTDKDPSITFDVENLNLKGRDAGILAFDFASDSSGASAIVTVGWESRTIGSSSKTNMVRFSAKNGKVLVPLDAAPRWLLAEGIKTIRVAIAEPVHCKTFAISNVTLFQRSEL